MILLNFTHPLTDGQRTQIETLTGQNIERVLDAPAHFDHVLPPRYEVAEAIGLQAVRDAARARR